MAKQRRESKKSTRTRKLRATANRIGERGEKKFDAAAADYGLIAAPFKNDYGFDFICQVDEDPSSAAPSGLRGELVGVSVRTTTKPSGRILLDRADAHGLLQAQFVTMVALVNLPKEGPETISVRVVDEAFRKELGAFLRSNNATISFTPVDFTLIAEVRQLLEPAFEPGFVQHSRIAAVMSGLEPQIPGVRLEVTQTASGSWTVVTADNLFSLFAGTGEELRDPRYLTAFGAPSRMGDRLRELDVAPGLALSLHGLPAGLVVYGATEHEDTEWVAADSSGESRCTLTSNETPDHTGWRHAAGWSLVISRSVLRDGVRVHELRAFADPEVRVDLSVVPDLNSFLLRCGSGARIGKASWNELPFEAWAFEDMPRHNKFAEWLADARSHLAEDCPIAYLRDAHDEETMRTLWWLSTLHRDPESPSHTPGFMLGDWPGVPEQPHQFSVPVLLNTTEVSLVAELQCHGLLATDDDDVITGVKITRVVGFALEASEKFDKVTDSPEFVFGPGLVIAVTDEGWRHVADGSYPATPLGLEVHPQS